MRVVIVDAQLNLTGETRAYSAEVMPGTSDSFPMVESEPTHSPIGDGPIVNSNETDSETESDHDDGEVYDVRDVLGPPVQDELCQSDTSPKCAPGPSDLSQSVDDGPKQLYIRTYPGHVIGTAQRRFNYRWFKLYPWLEYSKVTDSSYCFYCRHFGMILTKTREDRRKDQVFVQSGFRAWNRGSGSDRSNAFLQHMYSEEHRSSAEKYAIYKTMSASGKTVVDLLDNEHKKQVRVKVRRYSFFYLILCHFYFPIFFLVQLHVVYVCYARRCMCGSVGTDL